MGGDQLSGLVGTLMRRNANKRSSLKITTTPGKVSTKFVIDVVSTGDHYELETNALIGIDGFTAKFVDALNAPPDADG